MADTLTKAERSARMARVRGKDTAPELIVRKLVHSLGFRYRLHVANLVVDGVDARAARLNEHVRKIASARNISVSQMKCRYLTFESEWWVFAAEFALITHYVPEWNASGFGSKTPGSGRPGKPGIVSRWNTRFPKRVSRKRRSKR